MIPRYLDWRLPVAALAIIAAGVLVARHFDPDRSLYRAWRNLLSAVDDQNAAKLRARLDDSYLDRWGYSAESLAHDARRAFFHAGRLRLTASEETFSRQQDRATVSAILRLEAIGPEPVASARVTVNSLFSPCIFEWRRDPRFPWAWKLTRFDHPQLNPRRFGRNF